MKKIIGMLVLALTLIGLMGCARGKGWLLDDWERPNTSWGTNKADAYTCGSVNAKLSRIKECMTDKGYTLKVIPGKEKIPLDKPIPK